MNPLEDARWYRSAINRLILSHAGIGTSQLSGGSNCWLSPGGGEGVVKQSWVITDIVINIRRPVEIPGIERRVGTFLNLPKVQ